MENVDQMIIDSFANELNWYEIFLIKKISSSLVLFQSTKNFKICQIWGQIKSLKELFAAFGNAIQVQ